MRRDSPTLGGQIGVLEKVPAPGRLFAFPFCDQMKHRFPLCLAGCVGFEHARHDFVHANLKLLEAGLSIN